MLHMLHGPARPTAKLSQPTSKPPSYAAIQERRVCIIYSTNTWRSPSQHVSLALAHPTDHHHPIVRSPSAHEHQNLFTEVYRRVALDDLGSDTPSARGALQQAKVVVFSFHVKQGTKTSRDRDGWVSQRQQQQQQRGAL